jgi:FkbM family methyltransferase
MKRDPAWIEDLWGVLTERQRFRLRGLLPLAKAQLGQDLFVASEWVRRDLPSYFVEVGAADGVELSNSYLLETQLGWRGLVVEPARVWQEALKANRHCAIDHRCVTAHSGDQVDFLETQAANAAYQHSSAALSSMAEFAASGDWASEIRAGNSKRYAVRTVSLDDLLAEHEAPREIGYLSLDTEGSERLILEGHDFERYRFHLVTVEHNFHSANRQAIFALMTRNGYRRLHTELSRWDDWYGLAG